MLPVAGGGPHREVASLTIANGEPVFLSSIVVAAKRTDSEQIRHSLPNGMGTS
jgi:hypothetical protein